MNVRVVDFARTPHRQAQELLPWYLSGRLDDDQRHALDGHLDECPACRAELQWERELHAAMRESTAQEPDVDSGWALMRARIEAPRPGVVPMARRSWAVLRGQAAALPRVARFGLAAQFAVILLLAALVAARPDVPAPYRALSDPRDSAQARAKLVVLLEPDLRELDLREILRKAGARIVGGPNDAGAYLLSVEGTDSAGALRILRAQRGVRSAQPLEAGVKP